MGIFSKELSLKQMAAFTSKLSMLYEAGIPLARCFSLLQESPHRPQRRLMADLEQAIAAGATLSEAVQTQKKFFSRFFLAMLQAGEEAGNLSQVFADLLRHYEEQLARRRATILQLVYPACIIIAAAYGIPLFVMVMQGADGEQCLRFLLSALAPPLLGLAGVALVTRNIPRAWLTALPTPPVTALLPPFRRLELSNFLHALAMLHDAGLPVDNCIERAAAVVSNSRLRADLRAPISKLRQGATLGEAFAEVRCLPAMARAKLASGEQAGRVDSALTKAGAYLHNQADHSIRIFIAMIETLLILAIGLWIIFSMR